MKEIKLINQEAEEALEILRKLGYPETIIRKIILILNSYDLEKESRKRK